jgi:hypothetical protein
VWGGGAQREAKFLNISHLKPYYKPFAVGRATLNIKQQRTRNDLSINL